MEIKPATGGLLSRVEPGSEAAAIGLRAGDQLLSVNGHPLRDIIDFRFYGDEDELSLEYVRDGRIRRARAGASAGQLGVDFEAPTFDDIRRCSNQCGFCFLKGLPKGLRKSLYIKDDDFRYSFLYGNFVTLSNLTEDDWQRIDEQRLSPLYISVHATELEVRRRCLGNRKAPDILPQLDRLAADKIKAHTQVVLVPGVNDGVHLERTIADLVERHPMVQSVGIVPVGLTPRHRLPDHQRIYIDAPMRMFDRSEAGAALDVVAAWQRRLRKELGKTLVYASDELYLMGERPVPPARFYDGYPQYENGIGMVRTLLDDAGRLRRRLTRQAATGKSIGEGRRIGLLCGTSIAPTLASLTAQILPLTRDILEVIPVVNDFFGPTVTVSGLLTATDVLPVVRQREDLDAIAITSTMLDTPGERFLDGETVEAFERAINRPVLIGSVLSDVVG